jgi:hypothetical protein
MSRVRKLTVEVLFGSEVVLKELAVARENLF